MFCAAPSLPTTIFPFPHPLFLFLFLFPLPLLLLLLLHPPSVFFSSFWDSIFKQLDSTLVAPQLTQPTWASCSQARVMWRSSSSKRARTTTTKPRQPYFTLIVPNWLRAVITFRECSHVGGKHPGITSPLSEATRSKAWRWYSGRFMESRSSQSLSLLRMSGTQSRPATSTCWILRSWWAGLHAGSNILTRNNLKYGKTMISTASYCYLAISLIMQRLSSISQEDSSTTPQAISQKWPRQTHHHSSRCICPPSSYVSWSSHSFKIKGR